MTKKEKVAFAMETLEKLYPEIPIPLDHKDPYTLLIAYCSLLKVQMSG